MAFTRASRRLENKELDDIRNTIVLLPLKMKTDSPTSEDNVLTGELRGATGDSRALVDTERHFIILERIPWHEVFLLILRNWLPKRAEMWVGGAWEANYWSDLDDPKLQQKSINATEADNPKAVTNNWITLRKTRCSR